MRRDRQALHGERGFRRRPPRFHRKAQTSLPGPVGRTRDSCSACSRGCSLPAKARRNKRRESTGERRMATAQAVGPLSGADHASELRRAVIASTVGTTIEWYDFFLYSTVTGLVFAKLYFPNDDPLVGTLNAFGVYFVGFIARPIGAAIFGHYGDRIGRKATLIITLLLMGIATF